MPTYHLIEAVIDGLVDDSPPTGSIAVERQIARFVEHARRRGARPVLLSILADPAQPLVARQRAFGRIAAELDHTGRAKSPPSRQVTDAA